MFGTVEQFARVIRTRRGSVDFVNISLTRQENASLSVTEINHRSATIQFLWCTWALMTAEIVAMSLKHEERECETFRR